MCAQVTQCQGKAMKTRKGRGAAWQGIVGTADGALLGRLGQPGPAEAGDEEPGTSSCVWQAKREGLQGRRGGGGVHEEGAQGRWMNLGPRQEGVGWEGEQQVSRTAF